MRKRLLAVLLTAAMAVTTLVGCGSSEKNAESAAPAANGEANSSVSEEAAPAEDNAEVVELEFWGWWSSETRKPHMLTMVDNFNKSQSKYHVTYVDIPWGDIFTKNIAQIAAGNPCDIIANDLSGVQFRAAEGQVESVSPYLTDDVKADFTISTLRPVLMKTARYMRCLTMWIPEVSFTIKRILKKPASIRRILRHGAILWMQPVSWM